MKKVHIHQGSRTATRVLAGVGVGAIVLYGARFLLDFFGPTIPYAMKEDAGFAVESDEFLQFLSVVTDAAVRGSRIERLKNGAEFYPAELSAIRAAKHSINLEFYEFLEGRVSSEWLEALTERARAGVEVRVMVDAIGSFATRDAYFDGLRAAGGHMRWYHPIRWNTWQRINNRSHRKVLVVDGTVGFIGGAGVADHWMYPSPKGPAWRDSVFRVEGDGVCGLISTFSENWLEASGEILAGSAQFEFHTERGGAKGFVVLGTPHGGSTQSRILFQALIKSAKKTIRITTPYFLPDRSARAALVEAVVKRGVQVQILTAGPKIDHPMIRRMTHNSVHHLLRAGAEMYEYQPSMIHAKTLLVDDVWAVVGSTNFDHRSFALNDEVNLAIRDSDLAATMRDDFAQDLKQSKRLTHAMLERRLWLPEKILDRVVERES